MSNVKIRVCVDHLTRFRIGVNWGEADANISFLICPFVTGFRASEIYNLKVSDVDFEDNCITAVSYKGKGRRQRQFDMTKLWPLRRRKLVLGKQPEEPPSSEVAAHLAHTPRAE